MQQLLWEVPERRRRLTPQERMGKKVVVPRASARKIAMLNKLKIKMRRCVRCGNVFYGWKATRDRYCTRNCWYKRNKTLSGEKKCLKCGLLRRPKDFNSGRSECRICSRVGASAYLENLRKTALCQFISHRTAGNIWSRNSQEGGGKFCQKTLRISLQRMIGDAVGKPCPYCLLDIQEDTVSVDHRRPISRGGSVFELENLHVTCLRCNKMKSNISHEGFFALSAFMRNCIGEEDAKILAMRLLAGDNRFRRKS